jgi:hypothetical protein
MKLSNSGGALHLAVTLRQEFAALVDDDRQNNLVSSRPIPASSVGNRVENSQDHGGNLSQKKVWPAPTEPG